MFIIIVFLSVVAVFIVDVLDPSSDLKTKRMNPNGFQPPNVNTPVKMIPSRRIE